MTEASQGGIMVHPSQEARVPGSTPQMVLFEVFCALEAKEGMFLGNASLLCGFCHPFPVLVLSGHSFLL
jgi:hypothetical protein